MACLEMYNSEHKGQYCPPMSPRISFSNDFVETHHMMKQERSPREAPAAPASTDFEFSVTDYSMMSADELFFKGRLLPFKDNSINNHGINGMQRTIRDALLVEDDDDDYDEEENGVSPRPPKGSTSWKGLLGLKRSHRENKKSGFVREEVHVCKSSQQEVLNDGGGSSYEDVEIDI